MLKNRQKLKGGFFFKKKSTNIINMGDYYCLGDNSRMHLGFNL